MIQVYLADNTTFTRNGDLVLHPIECNGHFVINGTWEVVMRTPLDGSQDYLTTDAVIKAPFNGSDQLYRIYKTEPDLNGVTSYAVPIFLQAGQDLFFMDKRVTNADGQDWMDEMMDGTIYSGTSNVTAEGTAYYVRKNLIECLMSNEANSFLNRWGGEIYYNNYEIQVNQRLGQDRGMRVRLGQNMTGCNVRIDTSNLVTRIVPIAYNGHLLPPPYYVDSSRISSYPFVRTQLVRFEDIRLAEDTPNGEGYETLEELQTALQAAAEAMFATGIDYPTVTYDVTIADLARTAEFKDIASLVTIHLGDTVHVFNPDLNIDTAARCVEMVWNFLTETPDELILGDYYEDYFTTQTRQQGTLERVLDTGTQTVNAETISGILNAMQAQLRLQNTAAERSDVRAILFEDTDTTSALYGAMSIGTQGFQIANSVDENGDWVWKTFGTADGFSADLIIAGILVSQNYMEGLQGLKIDLNTGVIEAPQLVLSITNNAIDQATAAMEIIFGGDLDDLDARIIANEGGIKDHTTLLGDIDSRVTETEKTASDVKTYFQFSETDGMLIGKRGSKYKTQITDKAFNILYNNAPVGTFNNNGLETRAITLKQSLELSPLILKRYYLGWTIRREDSDV